MAEAPDEPVLGPPAPKSIPQPRESLGYRVDVASASDKVFPDTDFAPKTRGKAALSLARNESEAVQVIVEAPWRDVTIKDIELSALKGPNGAAIPANALSWRRVDFVETTIVPPYPVDRVGWYPDPLMPPGKFTAEKLSRTPVWVSVRTPNAASAGTYKGTLTVVPDGMKAFTIPLTVDV